jgi:predicted protein tyrosine phosphatase
MSFSSDAGTNPKVMAVRSKVNVNRKNLIMSLADRCLEFLRDLEKEHDPDLVRRRANRANVTPAPVSIVDRGTFCLMDLSRVGYVISICEYDERGKVVLRPDFRGQRVNLYFRDLTDGVGIASEADIEKTCKFSAKWALAARKDPEKAPLVVHCAAGISRSTAIAMIPLIAYYESVHLAARRLYQLRESAQPNTHVLYLIHQKLSLEENIYEILFQAQNPGLFD